jgi:predicted RND superfamily exporter protein
LPSLEWADEVEEEFDYDINTLSVYVDGVDELTMMIENLESRDDIARIESILDYIPEDMDRKVDILLKLDTLLKSYSMDLFAEYDIRSMTIEDLPLSVQDNYFGSSGKLRAEIVPNFNIYDRELYDPLIEAIVTEINRQPVGIPTIMNEITQLVKEDMIRISAICFMVVFIVAWIAFKKLKYAFLTVMPLGLTVYTTLGLLPLLNVEINVFSIAAFPLIIGIGIDSSIHLIHRLKESSSLSISDKVMQTGKAVMLTAFTTIIGFGSLANINHPGMANLGLAVAIGMTLSMIYTLMLIPLGYKLMNH